MVAFARFVTGGRRRSDASVEPRLPQGAEAALWSILEAVPDPRNHLALTRDLSGEVRVTDLDRALALAAAPPPPSATAPAVDATTPATPPPGSDADPGEPEAAVGNGMVDVREMVDRYYDLGRIEENAPLTEDLFTGADS